MRLWHRFNNNRYLLGVIGVFTIFLLLVWRNPFSERTLIPNFEPFPDSFHYVVPVRNLLEGKGFYFYREGGGIYSTSVPPLYSFSLLPVYLFVNDPRMFYVSNVLLAAASFFLFGKVLSRFMQSSWLKLFLLLVFVVATPFTWVPTLAMAENLLLPLFLLSILLLSLPLSSGKAVFAGLLGWMLYGTKYAAAPLTIIFFLLYLIKIWRESSGTQRWVYLKSFVLACVASASTLFLFEQLHKGKNPLFVIPHLLAAWLSPTTASNNGTPGLKSFFSLEFMSSHWPQYFAGIFGSSQKFLWRQAQLLPAWLAIFGGVGILLQLMRARLRERRWAAAALLLFVVGQGTFMSTFYDVDLRFIYITFPLTIIGFGWLVEWIWHQFPRKKWLPMVSIGILLLVFLIQNAQELKRQIGLNVKYAETPWYYVSVKRLNSYFDKQPWREGEKPVVISPMDPYLIDFYSNGKYDLLPLSEEQNHKRDLWPKIWGERDYSDFIAMYNEPLAQGRRVFVMEYGIGNEHAIRADFQRLEENFQLLLVQEGCHSLCDIYELRPKLDKQEPVLP